jgi:beta-glucosidase/6-phospho-beta-glucosidase/beta-galactosidase
MLHRLIVLALVFTGCSGEDISDRFPEGFLLGAATSGFQMEMGCPTLPRWLCVDDNSDWYRFVTDEEMIQKGGTHLSGEDPAVTGPGFWELYREDFDRLAYELNGNGLKMTLEWSRIFPRPTDSLTGFDELRAAADPRAVEHYHNLFRALRERDLTPLVILNHYTLPAWIHDGVGCNHSLATCSPRGWVDKDRIVREIAKYAGYAAAEFGGQVDLWCTLQSPFQEMLAGYLWPSADRAGPPALMLRSAEARIVYAALVEAHARMYDAVKANDLRDADGDGAPALAGISYAPAPTEAEDPGDIYDRRGAENVFYLWNVAYLNAVILGEFDHDLDGEAEYREDLAGRMDFLGMSYYTTIIVKGTRYPVIEDFSTLTTFDPFGFVQILNPEGIYELAMTMTGKYNLPIYITECGVDDRHDDGTAPRYIVEHLTWLRRAIRDGADVRSFFWNTLTDSYEWNLGTAWKYGLYRVDPDDPAKRRSPRRAAATFAAIAAEGRIPDELLRLYPVGE